ncbi:phosphohydrolase [Streptosporangium sp. CA-135522]|uniref:phosphohydrolase n=1 Tax=Streptosporangium sp. CA-135522 TaxID=3240072 RepID=UPI003D94651C
MRTSNELPGAAGVRPREITAVLPWTPEPVDIGPHSLDGAHHLRDVHQADGTLVRLVAHHSCAVHEATERSLMEALNAEFDPERPELVAALTYADMTTSPDGHPLDVDTRLAEIHSRYGSEHLVSRSIANATPCITLAVRAVQAALADSALSGGQDGH